MKSLPVEKRVEMAYRLRERFQHLGYWKQGRADTYRFASERGYPVNSVYRWLNAAGVPDLPSLLKLSEDLGVTVDWLLRGAAKSEAPALRPHKPRLGAVLVALGLGLTVGNPLLLEARSTPGTLETRDIDKCPIDKKYYVSLWGWFRSWLAPRRNQWGYASVEG